MSYTAFSHAAFFPRTRQVRPAHQSLSPAEFSRAVDALLQDTQAELERTQALHLALSSQNDPRQ